MCIYAVLAERGATFATPVSAVFAVFISQSRHLFSALSDAVKYVVQSSQVGMDLY